MAKTIGELNPIRYRGYYYDADLGMYYLQSRCYNPEMGRFISSDDASMSMNALEDLTAANLFAYCGNDPVNYVDPEGYYRGQDQRKGYKDSYGGIYNIPAYISDRYNYTNIKCNKKKILKMPNFSMKNLSGESSHPNITKNCSLVAITRTLIYYKWRGYNNIPKRMKVYEQLLKYNNYKNNTYPWKIDNYAKRALRSYGYKKSSSWNTYLWWFDKDVKSEVDSGYPSILNIAFGVYGNHSVTVCGYAIYTCTKKGLFVNTTVTKKFIAVYDGWKNGIRYIDYDKLYVASYTKIRVKK